MSDDNHKYLYLFFYLFDNINLFHGELDEHVDC